LVVDNARAAEQKRRLDGDWLVLGGDNRCREFSAWDLGLQGMDSDSRDAVCILANDTLHRSYGAQYLDGFTPERLRVGMERDGILGWIDAYPRPGELFGRGAHRGVRTTFLTPPRPASDPLRPWPCP